MNFKKLVKTGALFTLIAGITVTYVSKNDEIKAGIDNLKGQVISQFNGKKQAQAQLAEAQGKLDSIVSALGLDNSASIDEILSAINSKEADLSALAEALGLPAEATQEEIVAEINSLNSEVTELEGQADTLTAKINQLVIDLEQANSEEVEQLAYVNSALDEVAQTTAEEPTQEEPPAEAIEITLANAIKEQGWTGDYINTSYSPNRLYLTGVDTSNADAEQNKFNNSILAQYFTMNKNSNWYLLPTDSSLDLQVILENSK